MASDSLLHEETVDLFESLDLTDTQRENSPSNDSHSSEAFSPIQLDDRNDELEHDADSDSSGRDVSFDPYYRNKLHDRKKTKRRTSSSVFTFKKDNTSSNVNSQFDVVDLGFNTTGNEVKSSSSAGKNRRADMKWTTSQSFSSSTDENDVKVVPLSTNSAKSLLIDHNSIDSFLFPTSGNEKKCDDENPDLNSNERGDKVKKQSNTAVDGLLFEIYDKYHGMDHANATTESDITELSTTSMTSIYVASSFENDERPKLDRNYLQTKELAELEKMVKELKRGTSMLSSKLVRLLKQRDRNAHKIQENFNVLTALLQAISQKRRVDTRIRFSFVPRPGKQGFRQWVDALKAVSRISHGIPPTWRKRTWLSLAEYFLKDVDWERFKKLCFNDRRNPDDDELDTQIVKDLHRTGCGWFFEHDTAEDRASLKRVLLAYARWNKQIGYCQGFNVIAALILQVMEGNEEHALKVMIFLVDYVLPKNYFSNNLRALSVDMAVLRDLMQMKLPALAQHLQRLQREAMDQAVNAVATYEPPLINMFTMQWFLTLFATCLPRDTVLRIWDAVLLEGSEVLLRVALAIWAKVGSLCENVNTAAEFYMTMGRLIQELMTDEFINVQKLLRVVYQMASFPWSAAVELREKYTYDIHPFSTFRTDRKGERTLVHKPPPKPASDEEELADEEDPMVGCLGFVANSGVDTTLHSPVKTKHQRQNEGQRQITKKSLPVTPKTDITKVTPGAYITDQDARAYKEQMLAKELLRETEKLDLGKLRSQYGRMRRLQQKAMLVFNADDFKDESYKVKNPPSAINHLFVDVNNVTAPPRARYRKPSNFPALKAPSKGGSPSLNPMKDAAPKFVYENNGDLGRQSDSSDVSISAENVNRKPLERSDSFSITNPYVMHEVQGEQNDDSKSGTKNPDAHAEAMNKSAPRNTIKSPHVTSNSSLDDSPGDMKSTSLLYKVDKSALYPSNFKPFPSRNSSRRKMVSGK